MFPVAEGWPWWWQLSELLMSTVHRVSRVLMEQNEDVSKLFLGVERAE